MEKRKGHGNSPRYSSVYLDFEMLINMRREHQTKQAAIGVRTKKFKADSSDATTIRGKIIHELHEILKEAQDDMAIGTGADRSRRWNDNRVPAPGGRDGVIKGVAAPEISLGNATNAALAAAAVAKKASIFVTMICCSPY
jgi:hypothetical protein